MDTTLKLDSSRSCQELDHTKFLVKLISSAGEMLEAAPTIETGGGGSLIFWKLPGEDEDILKHV